MADGEISSNRLIANLWGGVNFCYPNWRSILLSMNIFEEPPSYDSYCCNNQEDQNGKRGISPVLCLHIGISSNCSSALRVMQFPTSWLWPASLGVLLSGAHSSPPRKYESAENCHLQGYFGFVPSLWWHPVVVLLVFQQLFIGAWSECEDGKESPELGWFSLCLPNGPFISMKEGWTKILAHTQRLALSLHWNVIYFFLG